MTKMTKEEIEIVKRLSKEAYHNHTGRNADEDPNWWQFMLHFEQEFEALKREYPDRVVHYIRLGYLHREITRELVANDQLWEENKNKPTQW